MTRTVVPEIMYSEYKALYLELRKDKSPPGGGAAAQSGSSARHYATRKSISVSQAAEITGLSESTIKRLDKDPKNTNYPGRNATAKILAAWAHLYRDGKIAAREVRAANRPMLGHVRS